MTMHMPVNIPVMDLAKHITQLFSLKHGALDVSKPPLGLGSPIFAARGGRVITARTTPDPDAGLLVRIDHGGGYHTRYLHLNRVLVKVGDMVAMGQQIGEMGYTGKTVPPGRGGTHLHFEVLLNEKKLDPLPFLQGTRFIGPVIYKNGKALYRETVLIQVDGNWVTHVYMKTLFGYTWVPIREIAHITGDTVSWENNSVVLS